VARAEGRRRKEDGERAGRVLDEDVAVGEISVQEPLRVALVDVEIAKAGGAEQAAVRDGARGQVERNRDRGGPQRRTQVAIPGQEAVGARAAEEAAVPEAAGPVRAAEAEAQARW
jgi:hypothetical protein